MIAVGAAHRLFMAPGQDAAGMRHLIIHQYNKAIALILPLMSEKATSNMHVAMICCLLFIAVEGLTGRYGALLRHLSAGNKLFSSLAFVATAEEREMRESLAELFCGVGIPASNFLEDDPELSGLSRWYRENDDQGDIASEIPFTSLNAAAYELRQIDFRNSRKPWHEEHQVPPEIGSTPVFRLELNRWSLRFDTFLQHSTGLSDQADFQCHNLGLRQRYWQMTADAYASELAKSDPTTFSPFLETANAVAAPLIALRQPTFSLDGSLISGLAFVVSTAEDSCIKAQGMNLLRKLDRREGIFDSREVVEMQELADLYLYWQLDVDFSLRESEKVGIPHIIQRLRSVLE